MLERIFGSTSHLKILLYLYGLKQRQRINVKRISQKTGLTYPTIEKVLKDFEKANLIIISGKTKSQIIIIDTISQRRKVVWKFLRDFSGSF